jgi:hypothetical protein
MRDLQVLRNSDKKQRFATTRLARGLEDWHHRFPMSKPRRRKSKKAISCDDCFFRCRGLCALDLAEPCSTFRPDSPDGLIPPRQPALLLRARDAEAA